MVCLDKKLVIFESIELSLGIKWLPESSREDVNSAIHLLVFWVIQLSRILNISLPYPLDIKIIPIVYLSDKEISLVLEQDENTFKSAVSYLSKNILYICSRVGIFVTLENIDNFRVNILSLCNFSQLYLCESGIHNEKSREYVKNTGRNVEVLLNDGTLTLGKLTAVSENEIVVEETRGKNKKKEVIQHTIPFDNIKSTKIQIVF